MRRLISFLVLAMAATLAVPLGVGAAEPSVDCGPLDGREYLTPDGLELDFDSPRATAPELAAGNEVTGDVVTAARSATFFFALQAAPAADARVDIELTWEDDNSDFDIMVFDEDGFELGRSDAFNVVDSVPGREAVEGLRLDHCQRFQVAFRSWAGSPATTLHASIGVTPGATLLACAEDDVASNCAGKSAGEAPDAFTDTATTLYFGGDRPGQAAMAYDYVDTNAAAGLYPLRSGLVDDRPTTGDPNTFSRVVVGFNDERNPLVPFWSREFDEEVDLDGDASALIWASTTTMDKGDIGTLFVDLYVNEQPTRAAIPGDLLGPEPRPFLLRFPDVTEDGVFSVTLQAATDPPVSSNGPGENPEDANHSVFYDSVQFQSRVVLPTA